MGQITIASAPPKFQSCFNSAEHFGSGIIDHDFQANNAAECYCSTHYGDCHEIRGYLQEQGFVLENYWARKPLEISRAPDKFKPYLQAGDLGGDPPERGDGLINSDKELEAAEAACFRDKKCDQAKMGRYVLDTIAPAVEERTLRIFLTLGVTFGYGHYYSGAPGGGETEADIPTYPADVQYGSAGGPVQTASAKQGGTAEPRIELGVDLWQYLFFKYKIGRGALSCAEQQYANGYDAYTAACFSRSYSNYFTVGFYPYINSEPDFGPIKGLPLRFVDALKMYPHRVEQKNFGGFLGVEAGLVVSKFSYDLGWDRWGKIQFDDKLSRSAYLYGLNLGVTSQILGDFWLGMEAGIETNIFPGAYFDATFKLAFPFKLFDGLKRTGSAGH